jgi:hypothetical protein
MKNWVQIRLLLKIVPVHRDLFVYIIGYRM